MEVKLMVTKCDDDRPTDRVNIEQSASGRLDSKYCWEGGVTKKRQGHNVEFWGPKRLAGPLHMVATTCYSCQASK